MKGKNIPWKGPKNTRRRQLDQKIYELETEIRDIDLKNENVHFTKRAVNNFNQRPDYNHQAITEKYPTLTNNNLAKMNYRSTTQNNHLNQADFITSTDTYAGTRDNR